jgi:hypothetical protein
VPLMPSGCELNQGQNTELVKDVFCLLVRNERRKGIDELAKGSFQKSCSLNEDFEFHFIGPIPNSIQT